MESAESQRLTPVAVGKQPEVANLDKTGGQDMEQEAADELDSIELHHAAAVLVPGVPAAEAHLAVIEAEEFAAIDGDAVRLAGQVVQLMPGSAEQRIGGDHPLCSAHGAKQRLKCAWCG